MTTNDQPRHYTANYDGRDFPLATFDRDSYNCEDCVINTGCGYDIMLGIYPAHNIVIGRYNSIAKGLDLCVGNNHNYKALSTARIRNIKGSEPTLTTPRCLPNKAQIIVQNDVWLGHNVTIMGGVVIGNGAVVAANSHVVKSVPPYAIVGGNPAKVIGYRFSPDICEKLNLIKWWYWPEEKIAEYSDFFTADELSQDFLAKFYEPARLEWESIQPPPLPAELRNKAVTLYFIDEREHFSMWRNVCRRFYLEHDANSEEVLLLVQNSTSTEPVGEYLEQNQLLDKANIFLTTNLADERGLFKLATSYIANHELATVRRSEWQI